MLDHVLDLALHCQEKESEEVDQKDGPKDGHIKYRKEGHKKSRAHALYRGVPELKFWHASTKWLEVVACRSW